jgi:16S rRNA (cytosine967-C5)-methyltransferase
MSSTDTPRLQPLLIRAVVEALHAIFCDNRHADKVIEQVLRNNKKAGSRDRAFIAESTYEIVRYYRLYTEILGRTPESQWDFWQLCGIHLALTTKSDLPKMLEFNDLDTPTILAQYAQLCTQRAFRESIPDWLDAVGMQELPDVWDDTLAALNKQAKVVLRANGLKTTRDELQRALFADQIESVAVGTGDALVLKRRQNIFQHSAFREGWFEVQDFSSQLVAQFLAPAPGMRVVDACAGGGGKTLHIAALMQNKGSIIALDTYAWKLDALRLRARRAGASNIEVRTIENSKTIKRLYHSADRLLLDVPCSGLGVLRRNPDSKWKLSVDRLDQLRATQKELLRAYSPMVKPGGQMVYATCSILPSENQDQVQAFLSSDAGKAFILLAEKRILPQEEGFDGFYMALMAKSLPESSQD